MPDKGKPRPLTARAIVIGAVAVVVFAAGLLTLLLGLYGDGSPRDQAKLDAVRTAGAVVAGLGAAIALLLAARRQRSTELTLQHQQEVAERAEHDATERRITELYTRAADQLGSERAPVRLAGLYALERLGQATPDQRQTIVNVICAYLRMPFEPPNREGGERDRAAREEEQVRRAAQRILYLHRRAGDALWEVIVDLDDAMLQGAYLPGADFGSASFCRAYLADADLSGGTLTWADLTSAALVAADLSNADLSGATLDFADLSSAKLAGANLAGVLLDAATWNQHTVWPDARVADAVRAASTKRADGRHMVGELRLSGNPKIG